MAIKKSEVQAQLAQTVTELWLYREALSARELGEADWIGQTTVQDTFIGVWLIHPLRAHGGLLLIRHEVIGQTPSFEVYFLDEILRQHSGRHSDYSIALHNLASIARRQRDLQAVAA